MNTTNHRRRTLRGHESLEERILLAGDVRIHETDFYVREMVPVGDILIYEGSYIFYEPYRTPRYLHVDTLEKDFFYMEEYYWFYQTMGDKAYYSAESDYSLFAFDALTRESTTVVGSWYEQYYHFTDDGYLISQLDEEGQPETYAWHDFETNSTTEYITDDIGWPRERPDLNIVASFDRGVYFVAEHSTRGLEPYFLDFASGTFTSFDINPDGGSDPGQFTPIGDDLYFWADDELHGFELRRINSTGQLTTFDLDGTSASSFAEDFERVVIGDQIYATGEDAIHRFDGTNITSFSISDPKWLSVVGDDLYFSAEIDNGQRELHRLDGDTQTISILNIGQDIGSSPTHLAANGTNLYFMATQIEIGRELFRLDTNTGRIDYKDITPGSVGSVDSSIFGGQIAFVGDWLFLHTDSSLTDGPGLVSLPADFTPSVGCDFTSNGTCDGDDIDLLMSQLADGNFDPSFDLNSDGILNVADRDYWLEFAGSRNLGPGRPYLPGDANLDGVVEIADFNIWNSNKFTEETRWTRGNFTADSVVDVSDWNAWNENKFSVGGELVTLSNRQYFARYVTEKDDHDVFQDFVMRPTSQWFIHTTNLGTTLQNYSTGRFMTGYDWNVTTTAWSDQSVPVTSRFWWMLPQDDDTIAFRNAATGRLMDGDGGGGDWDVDESSGRVLFDDAWIVRPVE